MIDILLSITVFLFNIILFEGIIIFAKSIYDDFFPKYEMKYVKLDADDWEMLKEQTRQYNEEKE